MLRAILLSGFLLLIPSSRSNGDDGIVQQLPFEARDSLEANAGKLAPISLDWTESGDPPGGLHWEIHRRITWQDGNFFAWTQEKRGKFLREATDSFDGKIFYTNGGNQRATYEKRFIKDVMRPMDWGTYFDQAGVTVPVMASDMASATGRSTVLDAISRCVSLHAIKEFERDGVPLLVVELTVRNKIRDVAMEADVRSLEVQWRGQKRSEDFIARKKKSIEAQQSLPPLITQRWTLLPQKRYAVDSIEDVLDSGVVLRIRRNLEFKKLEDRDIWLPMRGLDESYAAETRQYDFVISATPLNTKIIAVSALTGIRKDDVTFAVANNVVGTDVYDSADPSGVTRVYKVARPLEDIDLGPWYRRPRAIPVYMTVLVLIVALILRFGRTSRSKIQP